MSNQPPSEIPLSAPAGAIQTNTTLNHNPSVPLSTTFIPATTNKTTLVVCVNGLGLPQISWWPAISHYQKTYPENVPSFLTYDRYGQGSSIHQDPRDKGKEPGYGHDLNDVAEDLHNLITAIIGMHMTGVSASEINVILVANSIGCAVARQYTATWPRTISALLLLDSYMANSDFVSIYPNPDDPSFVLASLPEDVTVNDLYAARKAMGAMFHPSVRNREGFSRRNAPELLPHSDKPKLQGKIGTNDDIAPFVTIVGHDYDTFAEEGLRMPGMTKAVVYRYMNPYWQKYNDGLLKITDEGKAKGPVIAKGAGHFIQKDRPDLVATELNELLEKLER